MCTLLPLSLSLLLLLLMLLLLCVGVETNYKNPDQTKLKKKNISGLKLENDANKGSDD